MPSRSRQPSRHASRRRSPGSRSRRSQRRYGGGRPRYRSTPPNAIRVSLLCFPIVYDDKPGLSCAVGADDIAIISEINYMEIPARVTPSLAIDQEGYLVAFLPGSNVELQEEMREEAWVMPGLKESASPTPSPRKRLAAEKRVGTRKKETLFLGNTPLQGGWQRWSDEGSVTLERFREYARWTTKEELQQWLGETISAFNQALLGADKLHPRLHPKPPVLSILDREDIVLEGSAKRVRLSFQGEFTAKAPPGNEGGLKLDFDSLSLGETPRHW